MGTGLFDVLPKFSSNNFTYLRLRCTKSFRYDALGYLLFSQKPNLTNLVFGKLRVPMLYPPWDNLGVFYPSVILAARNLFRMILPAVPEGLRGMTGLVLATTRVHIPNVILLGSFVQMFGITATRTVTGMQNEELRHNASVRQGIRNAMRHVVSALNKNTTVPVSILVAFPVPAGIIVPNIFFNRLTPEPCLELVVKHVPPLSGVL
jgi:hypothetical protein